ncbi:MAG: hypothetical protein R3F11_10275 [Verrucomicrobiales bacterium]
MQSQKPGGQSTRPGRDIADGGGNASGAASIDFCIKPAAEAADAPMS